MYKNSESLENHSLQTILNLPIVEDNDLIMLEGYLIRGPPNHIRFISHDLCFEFEKKHIIDIQVYESELNNKYNISSRIFFKRGTPLKDLFSSKSCRHLTFSDNEPFAIISRLEDQYSISKYLKNKNGKFQFLENKFREKYTLDRKQ